MCCYDVPTSATARRSAQGRVLAARKSELAPTWIFVPASPFEKTLVGEFDLAFCMHAPQCALLNPLCAVCADATAAQNSRRV